MKITINGHPITAKRKKLIEHTHYFDAMLNSQFKESKQDILSIQDLPVNDIGVLQAFFDNVDQIESYIKNNVLTEDFFLYYRLMIYFSHKTENLDVLVHESFLKAFDQLMESQNYTSLCNLIPSIFILYYENKLPVSAFDILEKYNNEVVVPDENVIEGILEEFAEYFENDMESYLKVITTSNHLNQNGLMLLDKWEDKLIFTPSDVPCMNIQVKSNFKKGDKVVVSLEEFEARLLMNSNGFFEGFDWSNVVLAGGAVVDMLSSNEQTPKDFDLFLWGSEELRKKSLENIIKCLQKQGEIVFLSRGCVTDFFIIGKNLRIQVISNANSCRTDVINHFDSSYCQVLYDGSNVYFTPQALKTWITGVNENNFEANKGIVKPYRLYKSIKKGFRHLEQNVTIEWDPEEDMPIDHDAEDAVIYDDFCIIDASDDDESEYEVYEVEPDDDESEYEDESEYSSVSADEITMTQFKNDKAIITSSMINSLDFSTFSKDQLIFILKSIYMNGIINCKMNVLWCSIRWEGNFKDHYNGKVLDQFSTWIPCELILIKQDMRICTQNSLVCRPENQILIKTPLLKLTGIFNPGDKYNIPGDPTKMMIEPFNNIDRFEAFFRGVEDSLLNKMYTIMKSDRKLKKYLKLVKRNCGLINHGLFNIQKDWDYDDYDSDEDVIYRQKQNRVFKAQKLAKRVIINDYVKHTRHVLEGSFRASDYLTPNTYVVLTFRLKHVWCAGIREHTGVSREIVQIDVRPANYKQRGIKEKKNIDIDKLNSENESLRKEVGALKNQLIKMNTSALNIKVQELQNQLKTTQKELSQNKLKLRRISLIL